MTSKSDIAKYILENFYADPLGYVLYAFPWGVPGTALAEFPHGPDKWQREEFELMAKSILANLGRKDLGGQLEPYMSATASGHGIGKSAFVAWIIKFFMDTRPNCRGVVTANTGDQLEKKTWPELNKWHTLSLTRDFCKWTATKFYSLLTPDGEANWRFDCVTWSEENTEAFAGLHNAGSSVVVIMDEASAIPDKIHEVSEGAMTDGEPWWFQFGNPTRNTGRFKACFGKLRHRWHTRHVDSRSVRISNKKQIDAWIKDYGLSSDFVKVRVLGQFPAMGDKQFISSAEAEAAQKRVIEPDNGAALIMGIDPARFGSAQTVFRFRQGRDARSIPPMKFRGLDNMQIAYHAAGAITKYNPDAVCCDAGNGSGVIDRLRELKYKVHEVWFGGTDRAGDYADNRTAMWADIKDWLPGGMIDGDQELYDDLIGPEKRYTGKQGDTIKLESKAEMEDRGLASPDNGDALALTFAVRVARSDTKASRMRRGRRAEGVDETLFGE
jgi:hypothetical protein